jgi:hypothetical protein
MAAEDADRSSELGSLRFSDDGIPAMKVELKEDCACACVIL